MIGGFEYWNLGNWICFGFMALAIIGLFAFMIVAMVGEFQGPYYGDDE